jgi:hypothetical protein
MSVCNTARKIVIREMPVSPGARRWAQWITTPPSRVPRWLPGVVLTFLGVLLILSFLAIQGLLTIQKSQSKYLVQAAGIFGGLPLVILLFRYARRLRARHALAVLRKDRRPPLLLLRAFRDDYYHLPGYNPRLLILPVRWVTRTFEEYLHAKLSKCGPVIAIGRPGERTPPLGALRFWVSDDKWKLVVEELLQECQYALMIMGNLDSLRKQNPGGPAPPNTPTGHRPGQACPSPAPLSEDGLTWEVRRLFSLREIRKVILLMPPVDENEALSRWEQYRTLSKQRLPPYQGGELAAVFDSGGACWVLRAPLIKTWFRG